MIENFYPNPIVVQRLQAAADAHIDSFASSYLMKVIPVDSEVFFVCSQTYAWMQQQGLTDNGPCDCQSILFFRTVIRSDSSSDDHLLEELLAYLRTEA